MFQRRIPDHLRHAQAPGVRRFAFLAAMESVARGILVSVLPIAMYKALGDAKIVSEVYFYIGLVSFVVALVAPGLSQFIPRRWLYTTGVLLMVVGSFVFVLDNPWWHVVGLAMLTCATVVITICFNAYIMDYIDRSDLGQCETLRLFYSGAAWTAGPYLGIWLMGVWAPAPFIISAVAAVLLLLTFWKMRLGNGKVITRARSAPPNPFAYLGRFVVQPRLVVGWTFAVVRSCGWWVYVVYLPIYAVENGLSEQVGGIMLSISNGFLFIAPLLLKWMKGRVRLAIIIGFFGSGLFFLIASVLPMSVWSVIGLLLVAAVFLILLDICAGLPFLMAVRPSERTEMSAVYSTYRDVSGILTPGMASVVLTLFPLKAVFSVMAAGLFATSAMAFRLHPRLGNRHLSRPVTS